MDEQTTYDQYKRSYSFFTNTPMVATGFLESEINLLAKPVKESDIQFNPNVLDVISDPHGI